MKTKSWMSVLVGLGILLMLAFLVADVDARGRRGGGGRSFNRSGPASHGSFRGRSMSRSSRPSRSSLGTRSGSRSRSPGSVSGRSRASRPSGSSGQVGRADLGSRARAQGGSASERSTQAGSRRAQTEGGSREAAAERRSQGEAPTREAASERRAQTQEERGTPSENIGERQEDRQEHLDQAREDRQEHVDQLQEDRQQYAEHIYDEYKEGVYVYGYPGAYPLNWGYPSGGSSVSISITTFESQGCTAQTVIVEGATFYNCSGTWYQRAYTSGSVSYVVVKAPPGY